MMGGQRKAATTETRLAVVKEWNKGQRSQREIGIDFGLTRNAVGRLLTEARQMGLYVVAIDQPTASRRRWPVPRGRAV